MIKAVQVRHVTVEYESATFWVTQARAIARTEGEDVKTMENFRIMNTYDPASGVFGFKLEVETAPGSNTWVNANVEQIESAVSRCEWALAWLNANPAAAAKR